MRPSDPILRRRLRLHIAYRLVARLIISDQATKDTSRWWWKAALSGVVEIVTTIEVARTRDGQPPIPLVAALTTVDAVVWSGLGETAPINARGLAVVGVSTAIEAGYRLADSDEELVIRGRNVLLSVVPTLAMCTTRRLRRQPPGWGLLGWPALGAAAGYVLARYARAEERRRLKIAADLEADLNQVAKVLGAADQTDATAWNHVMRLESGLLTLARYDPTVADAWRALLTTPPIPPPGYVRLASVVREVTGDDNPLLHPRHAEQLEALGANRSTVRALPSPWLHRPGERLHLDVDGRQVILPATRHRLGSDAADRVIDPAPIVFAWGAALVVVDWIAYKPPVPLLVAVAAAECAVGAAHAKLRLSPAQTLRNALLVAGAVTCTGAVLRRQTDPTGTPGLVFGGSSTFPYALLLGHWWKTIDSRNRVANGLGEAGLYGLLAARASAIAPSKGTRRWWLRTFLLENTIWWGMLFVTAFGLDHDMEEDLAVAMDEADRVAAQRFDEAYTASWQASRDRVAARAALLERSLNTYEPQFAPDIIAAMRDDLAEVAAWLAEPSS